MCVVMCWQVVYVSVGSRKIVFLCVSVCRCVSSCVGRLFMCQLVQEKLCCCVSVCVVMCRQVVFLCRYMLTCVVRVFVCQQSDIRKISKK